MAKSAASFPILFLCFLIVCFLNPGIHSKFVEGFESKGWCVAKASLSDADLRANIEYACNNLPDCKLIQEGGSCFNPNTLINHASIVMNQYCASNGRNNWNCDFINSGLIAITDPSYNGCTYA